MVASKNIVVRDGVALILNSSNSINIIGSKGTEAVKEAIELQPDLLVYVLCPGESNDLGY